MSAATDRRVFEFGGYRLDAARRHVYGPDGGIVHLPSRAFDLLLFFVEHPGDLLDKATLIAAVWPTVVVEEANLTQCIYTLRRALGECSEDHRFVVTVPGRGYQFVAEVRLLDGSAMYGSAPSVDTAPNSRQKNSDQRIHGRRFIIAVALLGCVALGFTLSTQVTTEPARSSANYAIAPPQSIAVLPFVDLSPTVDMEYFADGITDELIGSLARVPTLLVTGRTSSFAVKGKDEDLPTIGEKLRVEHLVEGSVRREGERIRISAQLVRAADGYALWSQMYDRRVDDVLDIQGAIAREVVAVLTPMVQQGSLDAAGIERSRTQHPGAYTAFLQGMHFFRLSDWARARHAFQRAVELDPTYSMAHAFVANCYRLMADEGLGNPAELWKRARESMDIAMQIDPHLANYWWIQARFLQHPSTPLAHSARELEKALVMSPNDAGAMNALAAFYHSLGRHADALQMYERAYRTDPLWPLVVGRLAASSFNVGGDRQRMLSLLEEVESLAPKDPWPSQARAKLAFLDGRALDWDYWMARAVSIAPADLSVHGYLSLDYAHLGLSDAALHHARACQQINPQSAAGWYNLAHVLMIAGDIEAAQSVVQDAMVRHPDHFLSHLAQAELAYFRGDCNQSLASLIRSRPPLGHPPSSLNLGVDPASVPLLVWCHRQNGDDSRVQEIVRAFDRQLAGYWRLGPGEVDSTRVRLAAAMGDRRALISSLRELAKSPSMSFAFVSHEPMIQPYRTDTEVMELLVTLASRQREWREMLPQASVRVAVPSTVGAPPPG